MTNFMLRLATTCLIAQSTLAALKTVSLLELISPGSFVPPYKLVDRDWLNKSYDLTPVGYRYLYATGLQLKNEFSKSIFEKDLSNDDFDIVSSNSRYSLASAQAHVMPLINYFKNWTIPFEPNDKRIFPTGAPDMVPSPSVNFSSPLPSSLTPRAMSSSSAIMEVFPRIWTDSSCPYAYYYYRTKQIEWRSFFNSLSVGIKIQEIIDTTRGKYSLGPFKPSANARFDLKTCSDVARFVLNDILNNPTAPISLGQPIAKKLQTCYTANALERILDDTLLQYGTYAFFVDLLTRLEKPVETMKKYVLYSGSWDSTMWIMAAFNFTNSDCVIYDLGQNEDSPDCYKEYQQGSSFLIEVLEDDQNKSLWVKTSIERKYLKICEGYNDPRTNFACPLKVFTSLIRSKLHPDFNHWCSQPVKPVVEPHSNLKWIIIFTVAVSLIVISLGTLACFYFYQPLKKNSTLSRLFNRSNSGEPAKEKNNISLVGS